MVEDTTSLEEDAEEAFGFFWFSNFTSGQLQSTRPAGSCWPGFNIVGGRGGAGGARPVVASAATSAPAVLVSRGPAAAGVVVFVPGGGAIDDGGTTSPLPLVLARAAAPVILVDVDCGTKTG